MEYLQIYANSMRLHLCWALIVLATLVANVQRWDSIIRYELYKGYRIKYVK